LALEKKVKEDSDLVSDLKEIGIAIVSPDKVKKKQDRVYCCWPWGIGKHLKDNPSMHHHLCKEGIKIRKKWLKEREKPDSTDLS
jgi:hypothetical protein